MHEIKSCPRCQKLFECKSGSISLCHCLEVHVSVETRDVLARQYDDCLCKECLLKIEEDYLEKTGEQ